MGQTFALIISFVKLKSLVIENLRQNVSIEMKGKSVIAD